MQLTVANVDVLRQGWADALATYAPGVDDLRVYLESRLEECLADDTLDEQTLLGVVDEAGTVGRLALQPDTAVALARRLQRAVYEYLLSLDAATPEEEPAPKAAPAPVVGADEVAELAGHQAPASPVTEEPGDTVQEQPAAEAPTEVVQPEPGETPATDEAESAPEPAHDPGESDGDNGAARPGRFMVFRRNGTAAAGPVSIPAPPPLPPAAAAPAPPPMPRPVPVTTFPAPRDGFHLTDASDYEDVQPPALPKQPAVEPHEAEPPVRERPRGPSSRGWRVRSLRATREVDGAAVAPSQDEDEAEETPAENAFHNDPQAIAIRRQINERLRRRRCDDAASAMQKLAAEFGGRPVADLGLDAGDRCRALGKTNAALSCYLAASRADPVYDEPLLRLADVCIDDRDIDLAVSYLERVARLHRLRNDVKGALRVYRKIATIAPNREDILGVLMRAQATGRFDD